VLMKMKTVHGVSPPAEPAAMRQGQGVPVTPGVLVAPPRVPRLGTGVMLLCTGRCRLGVRCQRCVPRCEPSLASCGQPSLRSVPLRAGAPACCGREQDPSWRSCCWRPAQPRASSDPHQHHAGGPQLCCSMGIRHPSSWGPPARPCPRGSFSPPLALTLCPAPFPQGFPPSQPGGRENRSADGPLSSGPAQSKVGTSLGARRSRAHLSPGPCRSRGLLLPTSMLPTPRLGAPRRGHPHRLLPSQYSIFRPPAWRLLSFSH